ARDDDAVALVFAQLGERRVRGALAVLLNRRLVAPGVLASWLARQPHAITLQAATARAAESLVRLFGDAAAADASEDDDLEVTGNGGGLLAFAASGPLDPAFALLVSDLERLERRIRAGDAPDAAHVQAAF